MKTLISKLRQLYPNKSIFVTQQYICINLPFKGYTEQVKYRIAVYEDTLETILAEEFDSLDLANKYVDSLQTHSEFIKNELELVK